MFNPTQTVIEAFIGELRAMYDRTYGTLEPGYPGVISFVAQLALENVATSDARARYICAAHCGQIRALMGVLSSVYSVNVVSTPLFAGGTTELSATDA